MYILYLLSGLYSLVGSRCFSTHGMATFGPGFPSQESVSLIHLKQQIKTVDKQFNICKVHFGTDPQVEARAAEDRMNAPRILHTVELTLQCAQEKAELLQREREQLQNNVHGSRAHSAASSSFSTSSANLTLEDRRRLKENKNNVVIAKLDKIEHAVGELQSSSDAILEFLNTALNSLDEPTSTRVLGHFGSASS